MAITSSPAMDSTTVSTARTVDICFTGMVSGLPADAEAPCSSSRAARSLRLRIFMPASLSSAGVRVVATSTAMATQAAPTVPIRPRKGMPVMFSASRAMNTVVPANTTALPEVPLASAMDSGRL